ncbi:MAG: hypothetical protein K0S14_2056, partial [Thermomicrobiales bacterium]|nr:hypothetical protein [Thermomicrobiales bacterium]
MLTAGNLMHPHPTDAQEATLEESGVSDSPSVALDL